MGAGTNIQTRLYAMHHLDAPWKPRDMEQRLGRMKRQGNMNMFMLQRKLSIPTDSRPLKQSRDLSLR